LASSSVPIESFEIVIPSTNVGLGAWDLIGIFGGVPLFSWIMFGFLTRNGRCSRYEMMLNECSSRHELEQVALKWEYSLMLRLLGPHQGIRLERLRSELDDEFEKQEIPHAYGNYDQTNYLEKEVPSINDYGSQPTFQQPQSDYLSQNSMYAPSILTPSASEPADNVMNGYEWITRDGVMYYRIQNTSSEWTRYQG